MPVISKLLLWPTSLLSIWHCYLDSFRSVWHSTPLKPKQFIFLLLPSLYWFNGTWNISLILSLTFSPMSQSSANSTLHDHSKLPHLSIATAAFILSCLNYCWNFPTWLMEGSGAINIPIIWYLSSILLISHEISSFYPWLNTGIA